MGEDVLGGKRRVTELRRFWEIIDALIEFGFDNVVEELGLERVVSKHRKREIEEHTTPERLRLMFEDLGPTFIKLGQILSTRPDLVSREYIREFEKLRVEVKSFPYEEVQRIIEEELGATPEELYREFDPEVLAAASIGQVHRATLPTGERVAVKVQRPRIKKSVSADIYIIRSIADAFVRRLPISRHLDPQEIVDEFSEMIRREMDYTIEGRNIDRFYQNFQDDPHVRIPRVYWSHTRERVLTMDFLEGTELQYHERLREQGFDLHRVLEIGSQALMKMVFSDGFFHADPHPANILVIDGETIGILDFGAVGRLDRGDRESIAALYVFLLERDAARAADVLLDIGRPTTGRVDRADLERDLDDLAMIYGTPFMRLGYVMNSNIAIISAEHGIRLPAHFVLMERALFELEGVGLSIDPDFDVVEVSRPYIQDLVDERTSPSRIAGELLESVFSYERLIRTLPGQIQQILDRVQQGDLRVGLHHRNLDELVREIDRASTRLSTSLLVSAIVLASSILVLADVGPQFNGMPAIGLAGFILAGFVGAWLIYSILRGHV